MGKKLFIIFFLVLILTLPFINKAVHIDDVAFLYVARQIINDPFQPYSFNLEWSSYSGLAAHITTDPPLVPYYTALIILLFGEIEQVLHLSYIIFPLIVGISMFYISKKFTNKPLFAALFLISSVAFVVNSHNLMFDIPFLAFFLLSIAFFVYGTDSNNNYLIFLGAFFCGLAYLTKYSGLIIIPILVIYSLTRKKFKPILYLIVPLLIIFLWNLYTLAIYGVPHNLQILNWLFQSQHTFSFRSTILRLVTNFTYIGGATLFPLILLYPFIIDKKNRFTYIIAAVFATILSVILYFVSANFAYRYTIFQLVLFAFFLSVGLFFLFVLTRDHYQPILKLVKSRSILNNKKYANNIFLFSWFLIGFLYNSTLAGGAVRYVTVLIPPMTIMYFNIIEYHKFLSHKRLKNFVFFGFLLTFMLSIAIAYADYELANTYRSFSKIAKEYKTPDNEIWYSGHLGFQYYMDKNGYAILKLKDNSPKKGDIVIKARLPSPRKFSPLLKERLELLEIKSYKGNLILKVHNPKARAGFYTYGGGFLPYSFSRSNLEDFEIYRVIK